MTKKERVIEVSVEIVDRDHQSIQQVFIGKQMIGEFLADNRRFEVIMSKNGQKFYASSQEESLKIILQQYHLHQY